MSLSKGLSFSITGLDAMAVTVEVDIRRGLPSYKSVGLGDKAVSEGKNRIAAAIKNSGFEFPAKKITVNLAPAYIKKEGSSFDFPIALGVLKCLNNIKEDAFENTACIGELSLDGSLRKVCGALPIAFKMKSMGVKKLLLPEENAREAAVVNEVEAIPVKDLRQAVSYLNGEENIYPGKLDLEKEYMDSSEYDVDFSEIKGQYFAKRAMEIAAAGGHNLLMTGPPGAGKTMLARRLVTILPPMTVAESIEVSLIQSVIGELPHAGHAGFIRPFRSPHHTASDAAMVGGGAVPRPGEVTLAHRGVLFLDEFPEFKRKVIEVIRQPLEERKITVSRAHESVTYPAAFMLVAAMNPCPCGFDGSSKNECSCTPRQVVKYRSKISGPIMDRIDMHVEVPQVKRKHIRNLEGGESSKKIRSRVTKARLRQNKRYRGLKSVFSNADLRDSQIEKYCRVDNEAYKLALAAVDNYGLSLRAFNKVMKVAMTAADIESSDFIKHEHVAEALQYRNYD